MSTALENMQRAMDTYRERNKLYGDNYKHFGEVMAALYPSGLSLCSVDEWNRFGVLIQIVSKLTRYVSAPYTGHVDSIHDMGVYCFMLEELDSAIAVNQMPDDDYFTRLQPSLDRKAEEILSNPCEHVYSNGKCIVAGCGEKEPDHNNLVTQPQHHYIRDVCTECGDKVRQFEEQMAYLRAGGHCTPKVIECPHCGPSCLGGAAHFARQEDGVFYKMEQTKEYDYKNPSDCPHHSFDAGIGGAFCNGCGIDMLLVQEKEGTLRP